MTGRAFDNNSNIEQTSRDLAKLADKIGTAEKENQTSNKAERPPLLHKRSSGIAKLTTVKEGKGQGLHGQSPYSRETKSLFKKPFTPQKKVPEPSKTAGPRRSFGFSGIGGKKQSSQLADKRGSVQNFTSRKTDVGNNSNVQSNLRDTHDSDSTTLAEPTSITRSFPSQKSILNEPAKSGLKKPSVAKRTSLGPASSGNENSKTANVTNAVQKKNSATGQSIKAGDSDNVVLRSGNRRLVRPQSYCPGEKAENENETIGKQSSVAKRRASGIPTAGKLQKKSASLQNLSAQTRRTSYQGNSTFDRRKSSSRESLSSKGSRGSSSSLSDIVIKEKPERKSFGGARNSSSKSCSGSPTNDTSIRLPYAKSSLSVSKSSRQKPLNSKSASLSDLHGTNKKIPVPGRYSTGFPQPRGRLTKNQILSTGSLSSNNSFSSDTLNPLESTPARPASTGGLDEALLSRPEELRSISPILSDNELSGVFEQDEIGPGNTTYDKVAEGKDMQAHIHSKNGTFVANNTDKNLSRRRSNNNTATSAAGQTYDMLDQVSYDCVDTAGQTYDKIPGLGYDNKPTNQTFDKIAHDSLVDNPLSRTFVTDATSIDESGYVNLTSDKTNKKNVSRNLTNVYDKDIRPLNTTQTLSAATLGEEGVIKTPDGTYSVIEDPEESIGCRANLAPDTDPQIAAVNFEAKEPVNANDVLLQALKDADDNLNMFDLLNNSLPDMNSHIDFDIAPGHTGFTPSVTSEKMRMRNISKANTKSEIPDSHSPMFSSKKSSSDSIENSQSELVEASNAVDENSSRNAEPKQCHYTDIGDDTSPHFLSEISMPSSEGALTLTSPTSISIATYGYTIECRFPSTGDNNFQTFLGHVSMPSVDDALTSMSPAASILPSVLTTDSVVDAGCTLQDINNKNESTTYGSKLTAAILDQSQTNVETQNEENVQPRGHMKSEMSSEEVNKNQSVQERESTSKANEFAKDVMVENTVDGSDVSDKNCDVNHDASYDVITDEEVHSIELTNSTKSAASDNDKSLSEKRINLSATDFVPRQDSTRPERTNSNTGTATNTFAELPGTYLQQDLSSTSMTKQENTLTELSSVSKFSAPLPAQLASHDPNVSNVLSENGTSQLSIEKGVHEVSSKAVSGDGFVSVDNLVISQESLPDATLIPSSLSSQGSFEPLLHDVGLLDHFENRGEDKKTSLTVSINDEDSPGDLLPPLSLTKRNKKKFLIRRNTSPFLKAGNDQTPRSISSTPNFRPPRDVSIVETDNGVISMDSWTFNCIINEFKVVKTQLLKLKRELQEVS